MQADDVERARRFYEAVFGWRFASWGLPEFYLIRCFFADTEGNRVGAMQYEARDA